MSYRKGSNKARKRRENIMTPLNWITWIIEAILVGGAILATDSLWLQIGLFFVAVSLLIFYCSMYWFWATKDPNRLQTEDFNLISTEMMFNAPDQSKGITTNSDKQVLTIQSPRQ